MNLVQTKSRPRRRMQRLGGPGRYYRVWSRRRGLGDDAPFVTSGDVAPPDPNLIARELRPSVSQQDLTNAVVSSVNAQIAADNITTPLLPYAAFKAGQFATGTSKIGSFSLANGWILGSAGLLAGLAYISSRGKRR